MTTPTKSAGLRFDPKYIKLARARQTQPVQPRAIAAVPQKTNMQLFKDGNEYLAPYIKPGAYPFVEQMREASLAGDFEKLFQLMPKENWTNIPLGKFRFNWGPDGKPRWVTFSKQDMQNYFRGPWLVIDKSWGEQCPEDFINKYAYDYWAEHARSASMRPNTHAHHMYRKMFPAHLVCKAKKGSIWVRVRKPVVAAAAIVSAVYLGPAALAKIKAVAGGAGSATSAAVSGGKIAAGAKGLVKAVNTGRTVKAIADGKLPPPPINVSGQGFKDWAFMVAKDEYAKKVQRDLTKQEEAAIKAEIAQLQIEIDRATPPDVRAMPPQPMRDLSPQIKTIQVREENANAGVNKLLIPAAMVAAALLLGG